jgi:hypothetical protein
MSMTRPNAPNENPTITTTTIMMAATTLMPLRRVQTNQLAAAPRLQRRII